MTQKTQQYMTHLLANHQLFKQSMSAFAEDLLANYGQAH